MLNVECVKYFFDGFCELNKADKATVEKRNDKFVFIDQEWDNEEYLVLNEKDFNEYFKIAD